ncbi:MAG: DOMON-like domain-containing protein [Deltaproteobacteria bacterium]|nr:DOMON-like domain-containing protein [Deltaproteobacteria bacterium]
MANSSVSEFKLVPFKENELFSILGIIDCSPQKIHVGFLVEGPLKDLIIPKMSIKPQKKDKLWEQTCFEIFLSEKSADKYFELNFSPSRDWAIYSFDDYRELGASGRLKTFNAPEIAMETSKHELKIEILLDNPTGLAKKDLDIGITAVLQEKNLEKTFWALTHLSAEPDFHKRDTFVL